MSKHRHHHDRRREQFATRPAAPRRGVSPNALVIAAALLLLAAVIFAARSEPARTVGTNPPAIATGQDVSIPLSDLEDGQARFHRYVSASGREVRFFVMKSSDGVARAAFDTCDVCFRDRRGYRQVGDDMICNKCGQAFPSRNINVLQGGCNPAPIERSVEDGRVVIRAAALEQGQSYF